MQREGAEDILDFWLDVQQHENLCRAYFKDVRKSGRTIKDDWPQYWDYARRRGSIYGTVVGLGGNSGGYGTKRSSSTSEAREKEALGETDYEENIERGERGNSPRTLGAMGQGKEKRRPDSPMEEPRSSTPFSLSGRASALLKRSSRAPTIIARSSAITRSDLVASAERIYFRYLAPPSHINATNPSENHEIYLPPALRIHSFPISSTSESQTQEELAILAQVPDMFHAQKQYCFRAMEQDAFPRFLRAKAFGNLTPVSALVRLVVGLVTLWIGLAVGFALIFLDVQPKSKRFFVSYILYHLRSLKHDIYIFLSYSYPSRSPYSV